MNEVLIDFDKKIKGCTLANNKFQEFRQALNDKTRIRIIFDILNTLNFIPNSLLTIKSSVYSTELRNDGNQIFISKHDVDVYMKAWEFYSKSVAFAPNDSVELALAFANRSAVLVHFRKYSDALQDIDRALNLRYPDHLKAKLLLRKVECLALLGNSKLSKAYEEALFWLKKMSLDEASQEKFKNKLKDASKLPKTTIENTYNPKLPAFLPKKEVPCATDALAVKYNEKFGRHVVATRKIKPGEILAVEKAYSVLLSTSSRYTHCAHCLKVSWASIPCEHCVFVLYCSENCKNLAWKKYHDIECSVTGFLLNLDFINNDLFSLRLTITAIREFNNLESLKAEMNQVDSCKDPRTKGFSKDGKLYSNKYRNIYSLVTNTEKLSFTKQYEHAVSAALILYFVATRTAFVGTIFNSNDLASISANQDAMFVGELILRNRKLLVINAHEFPENYGSDFKNYAYGVLSFHSLLNHSCYPKVSRYSVAEHMILFATHPIEKGSQIFDNYGMHCDISTRDERQLSLADNYYFKCECTPCQENWPKCFDLNSVFEAEKSINLKPRARAEFYSAFNLLMEYTYLRNETESNYEPHAKKDLIKIIEVFMKYVNLPFPEIKVAVELLQAAFYLEGSRFDIPQLKDF